MKRNATPIAGGTPDTPALEREVEALLARAIPSVDLLELTVRGGRPGTMRVVVDHPDGVDHDLCADVTGALEAGGMLERFGIEVWSPGPEPPLRTDRHFRRAVGSRVRVEVADDDAPRGRRAHVGTLVQADGRTLRIAGDARDEARETAIDLSTVRRARVVEANIGSSA